MSNERVPWAKLIFQPDVFKDPVEIFENRIVIGRSPACGLRLQENKHVSSQHCAIEKMDDGHAYVVDLSANGTFLNGNEKIGKGKKKEVADGSIVCLVNKAGNPAANLFFTLKLTSTESMDGTLLYSPDPSGLDMQQEITVPMTRAATRAATGQSQIASDMEPPAKKFRQGSSIGTTASTSAASAPSSDAGLSTKPKDSDGLADNLVCSICFDIIHDCISLQPCMHCFCAGCYSEWRERSEICPDCRVKVSHVSKNHMINNVINAYLASHPEKKRSEDEIKALDAKNKITQEMLNPKDKKKETKQRDDESTGSDVNESDSSDSDGSDDEDYRGLTGLQLRYIPPPQVAAPQCRMCPGFHGFHPMNTVRTRVVLPYVCPAGQLHARCTCCQTIMPDRRQENNPTLPPISCSVCQRTFCDLYFGCPRIGCIGCLARFKDLTFPDTVYNFIVCDNQYETNVLKAYMAKTKKAWADILKECLEKMDKNEFLCPDKSFHNLTPESHLCQDCASRNFRELVYQYRQHIPKQDLPADVTRRPDCYWGRNCRTQKTKYHHAA